MADVFDALAAPTRRAILDALVARGEQTLFELVIRLRYDHDVLLSRQAISQHLQVLEEVGLVTTRRDGRYKFHSLNAAPLAQIAERWTPKETP
jgi:DNA-binding transcriptional ArsR family regulator